MNRKFKFSQSHIKNLVRDIGEKAKQYHLESFGEQQLSSNKLAATLILNQTLRYYAKKDNLQVVTSEKDSMGNYISAIFPLSNKIAVLKEEYYQILSSDSYWLPIIIAHELGHWILHAATYRKFKRQIDLFLHDNQIGSTFDEIRNIENPKLDLLDQQANLFARELLLPEENLKEALHTMGYYSPVIYKAHHLNLMPFEEYKTRLAEKIQDLVQVPILWLCHRLIELNMLQNHAVTKQLHSG